jgi:hypothetical protein
LSEDTKDKKEKEVEEKGFADDKGVKEGDKVDSKIEKAEGAKEVPAETGLDKDVKSAAKAASNNVKDQGTAGTDGSKDAPVASDDDGKKEEAGAQADANDKNSGASKVSADKS